MTNEAQMTKDEKTLAAPPEDFVILVSSFLRHPSVELRHF
jgi:hypothetical protein